MTKPYLAGLAAFALLALVLPSCGGTTPHADHTSARFPDASEKSKPQVGLLKNEIPADQLDSVLRAHYQGLGFMERYEYRKAGDAFGEAHERAPGWIPGAINLAIARLNDTGTQEQAKKSAGAAPGSAGFEQALHILDEVITRDPANLHAHYCRGLILEFLGGERSAAAHKDFLYVAEQDPNDGHVWLKVGSTLTAADNPRQPAGPKDAEKLIQIYSKALACNPYLINAHYKLQQVYGWSRQPGKQKELLERWHRLNPKDNNPAGPGDTAEAFYGETGKYARIINPFPVASGPTETSPPPRFGRAEAIHVHLRAGETWGTSGGPDVRRDHRTGAVCTFDADGDGRLDLYFPSAVSRGNEFHDVLLINTGGGKFADMSAAWGVDKFASTGAAASDFDADRRVDLFLSGSENHLLRNTGEAFEDLTEKAGMGNPGIRSVTARWLDLDQDGDLDLYVVNESRPTGSETNAGAVRNSLYRNVGKPPAVKDRPPDNWAPVAVAVSDVQIKEGLAVAFAPWPDAGAILGPSGHSRAIAALDLDDDRDLDVVIGGLDSITGVLNDRLGAFHETPMLGLGTEPRAERLLVADFDKDGRADLAGFAGASPAVVWRNVTDPTRSPRQVAWEKFPTRPVLWKSALATDVDLDTWPDLVGIPSTPGAPDVQWLRNVGGKLVEQRSLVGPLPPEVPALAAFAMADVVGDALPDLILLPETGPPLIARNLGNGNHWLSLDLNGRWKTSFDHMRSNPHGLGTRLTLEGQGLLVTYDHTTPAAGHAQSVGPIVLGLGKAPSVELVRLRWPDGTMQCELNQKADVALKLNETNRKTGSCPVLFTWNGARFECLGDFLGGGGLGYLVAPGVYGQPDRDESVAVSSEQLKAEDGTFRLSITEPMDEVAYLDRLQLVVVDRPPGVSSTPDERFAPEGTRPTGDVIAWKTTIHPERATDLNGLDVTRTLRDWDRRTVDNFRRLDGWIGYAEEHGIILDFGDRLSRFGPKDPLVLCLAGWVEYPYSQTNYAAATAGVTLRPPVVELRNPDGSWSVIEAHAGYPAGLPRLTTLDLTGTLNGPTCVIRLKTNMECYWDQAFIALRDTSSEASLKQTTLPVARALLGHRGYTREVSPDGRLPLLYDYDHVDPAPLALMKGRLTRYGDVKLLLTEDDDHLCLVGPGDEVRLEFDAGRLPTLTPGWSRSYVLRAVGYCKDSDPLTATGDSVEPLPWRLMPAFPFHTDLHRPADPAYQTYLDEFQGRTAGSR